MNNGKFNEYQLSGELLKAISLLKFNSPTKVQERVIPAILNRKDIIVKSQTGSGKTASFAIPICELLDWDDNKPQVLVLTPTRELAVQVREDVFHIGRFKRIKVAAIYGKHPFHVQEKELKQKTHVVVGTPGRVIDHIERGTLDTSKIKYLVLDEADEMLNMGFSEQIETIITSLPHERVNILLSATIPQDIQGLCSKIMVDPIFVEIEDQNPAAQRIVQERYHVAQTEKLQLLRDLTTVENPDSCMIFCNTRQTVDAVCAELAKLNYSCEKLHGGLEQRDRLSVIEDFKRGFFRYLCATDVAARGLDIEDITLVINYDIPHDRESYVHRIGRTGRLDKLGKAITFVTRNEDQFLKEIHDYIGQEIPLKAGPDEKMVQQLKNNFMVKNSTLPEIKESRGALLSTEILKIHLNAGKKTKMRPADIVGALCSIQGMTAADIGIINIKDVSTFIEILNNKGGLVLRELQSTPIKGRLRKVSKADR